MVKGPPESPSQAFVPAFPTTQICGVEIFIPVPTEDFSHLPWGKIRTFISWSTEGLVNFILAPDPDKINVITKFDQ